MKSLQELAAEALLQQINPVHYSTFLNVSGLEDRLKTLLRSVSVSLRSIRRLMEHRRVLEPLSEYLTCTECGYDEVPMECDRALFDGSESLVLCKERDVRTVSKRIRETEDSIRDFCTFIGLKKRRL